MRSLRMLITDMDESIKPFLSEVSEAVRRMNSIIGTIDESVRNIRGIFGAVGSAVKATKELVKKGG
jgi:hypothetical protein